MTTQQIYLKNQVIFYKEAFEALYYRHDSHKGAFKRGLHAGLPIDKFERVFSHFCFTTLRDSKIEFSYEEILKYFRISVEFCEENIDPELVLLDAFVSTSILRKDGNIYDFVHRSFQEYFAARFSINFRGPNIFELIDNIGGLLRDRNVNELIFEMNPDLIENVWIVRKCTQWLESVGRSRPDTKRGLSIYFKNTFGSLGYGPDGKIRNYGMLPRSKGASWMGTIDNFYENRPLARRVFQAKLATFDQLQSSLPEKVRLGSFDAFRAECELAASQDFDARDRCPDVYPKDADWLIYSGLPQVFLDIKNDVTSIKATIEARVEKLRRITAR